MGTIISRGRNVWWWWGGKGMRMKNEEGWKEGPREEVVETHTQKGGRDLRE